MATKSTDMSSPYFDLVFEGRKPLFFTSATLHRSMGGHGLALPSWTLPTILFHEPLPYDARKIRTFPPASDTPDQQQHKLTVKDAVGNTWMLEQDLLEKHKRDLESIQANADGACRCIRNLDFTGAVTLLNTALGELWPCHHDMSLHFWLQLHLAHVHFRSAFFASNGSRASILLDQALQIFNECIHNCHKNLPFLSFNRSLVFSSLVGIAWIYFFKGDMPQANGFLRASETVMVDRIHLQQRGNSNLDLWCSLATFHAAWGDVKDAIQYMKKVGYILKCPEDIYQISIMDAHMLTLEGQYRSALMLSCHHLKATPSFDGELQGKVAEQMEQQFSGVIGDIWYMLGINSEALPAYEAAFSEDNLLLRSASLVGQGNCHMRMLNKSPIHENIFLEQAERCYSQALTIYEGLGHRAGKAIAHCNLGTLYYERKDFSQALHHYSVASEESLGDVTGLQCRMAQLYMALDQWSTAHDLLQTSFMDADKDKPMLFAWICHNLGLFSVKSLLAKSPRYLTLDGVKCIAEAKEHLIRAVEIFDKVQSQFLSVHLASPLSITVFEDQKESFRLLEWCFASEGKAMEAFVWAERGRSKLLMLQSGWDDLVESQASDRGDKHKSSLYRLGSEKFEIAPYDVAWRDLMSWKTCCSLQKSSTVVVEYTICKDLGLLIYVIDGSNRPKMRCIAFTDLDPQFAGSEKIEDFVNQTVHMISEDEGNEEEVELRLSCLYDLLIRPVEKHLEHSSQLIIVPHEVLFKVPFAALVSNKSTIANGTRGNYLVEKFVISLAESLRGLIRSSLLQRQHSRYGNATQSKSDDSTSNLVVGIMDHSMVGEASLQQAEVEARQVAGILEEACMAKPVTLLLGKAATKDVVVQQLQRANLVHLATHAVITNKYEEGAILFSMPGDSRLSNVMDSASGSAGIISEWSHHLDLQSVSRSSRKAMVASIGDSYRRVSQIQEIGNEVALDAQALVDLQLKAKLVVLSACETGRGVIAGEGVAGLGRAFSKAGATCCVLSLWLVWDTATCHFMQAFYKELAQGKNVALAVQSTMLYMIQQKTDFGVDRWKVVHWAAFIPYGLPSSCIY